MRDKLGLKGRFNIQVRKNGLLVAERIIDNTVVDEGVAQLFDSGFGLTAALSTWYIGLIDNTPTPTINTTDTLASKAWTEFTTYTGTRPVWNNLSTVSRTIGTSAASPFPITGSGTLYGMFICSVTSGTAGILWAAGAFTSTLPVTSGSTINATYTLQG